MQRHWFSDCYLNKEEEYHEQLLARDKELDKKNKQLDIAISKAGNFNNSGNIILNIYGKENLDYLTTEYLQKIIKGPFGAIQRLIKDLHFNPEHPENHNIKITNKKFPHVSVYEGENNGWQLKDKKEMITDIVDKSYNKLEEHYDEYGILDDKKEKNYKSFQYKFDNNDKRLVKTINKETELIILNGTKDLQ